MDKQDEGKILILLQSICRLQYFVILRSVSDLSHKITRFLQSMNKNVTLIPFKSSY